MQLAGFQGLANFTVPSDSAWHDVPGAQITLPAAKAMTLKCAAQYAVNQGSAAKGGGTGMALQVVDAATGAVLYLFALDGFQFASDPVSQPGAIVWRVISNEIDLDPLAAAVTVKLQAQVPALTGLGAAGLYPATFNGKAPIKLAAVER